MVAMATAASAVLLALAWWVSGRTRELFAHAAAVSGSVALVGAAAEIATRLPPQGSRLPAASLRGSWNAKLEGARPALILLAILVLLGAAYAWTR